MWESDNLVVVGLSNGVAVNLDVFLMFMIDRVSSNLDGTGVVSM